jgi:hypothetical protein
MRLLWKNNDEYATIVLPPSLRVFIDIILEWHGKNTKIIMKELLSTTNCDQQRLHRDYVYGNDAVKKRRRINMLFSCIIALEDNANASKIINHNRKEIVILQGSVLIWRGEYYHAGGKYSKVNRRLFFHVLGPDVDESVIDTVEL